MVVSVALQLALVSGSPDAAQHGIVGLHWRPFHENSASFACAPSAGWKQSQQEMSALENW